jgi:anti-sigma regulatory factor (Ser/Thr protein kinase)
MSSRPRGYGAPRMDPATTNVVARFQPVPESVAVARRFVEHTLAERALPDEPVETAVLLTSELVGNAVVHADDHIDVRVVASPSAVRVEVLDSAKGEPVVQAANPLATSGRGLRIVASLATTWGTKRLDGRKVVWFELALA